MSKINVKSQLGVIENVQHIFEEPFNFHRKDYIRVTILSQSELLKWDFSLNYVTSSFKDNLCIWTELSMRNDYRAFWDLMKLYNCRCTDHLIGKYIKLAVAKKDSLKRIVGFTLPGSSYYFLNDSSSTECTCTLEDLRSNYSNF